MPEPLISIIMPTYNSELYIEQALLSCLHQTYKNIEILVIDDGSTDNTINLIKSLQSGDSRIKLFLTPDNRGPAIARNIGLQNALGEYITFLDSDDFISKDKIKKQIEFMLERGLLMTHGNYNFCDLDGNSIKSIRVSDKINYKTLLKGNQFKIMTVLIKKEKIKNLKFDNIKHEDYAFFLDCLKIIRCSYLYCSGFDSFVRIGKVSVSSNKLKSAIWTYKIYSRKEGLGFFKSIYYFIHYAFNGFLKYRG